MARHASQRRTTLGNGHMYRGVPRPADVPVILEPEVGEPACSHCGGKVRVVKYDPGTGKRHDGGLAGNHRVGGTGSKGGVTCPGSYVPHVYKPTAV